MRRDYEISFPISLHSIHIVNTKEEFAEVIDASINNFILNNPLAQVPTELAVVPTDGGILVDHSSMHRIRMFNCKVFDRLTTDGYKLNLIEGRYEK